MYLLAMVMIAMFSFSSCSKDDDKDEIVPKSIKSTIWEGIQDDTKATVSFSDLESTLILQSTTSSVSLSVSYSYTYEHPIVTMFPKVSGNAKMQGTIDGNKMMLVNTSTNKTVATLTKK